MQYNWIGVVEIAAAVTMLFVPAQIIQYRLSANKAIGVRAIQFTAVGMVMPLILILGLEHLVEPSTLGVLIAGLIGYMLSGVTAERAGGGD
jgi:hypothetical protein